jgi:hypothetical protein
MEMKERNTAIKNVYSTLDENEKATWLAKAKNTSQADQYSPEVVKKIKIQLQSQVI